MAWVYKARYFPFDDVLNSKKGSNPSYAWRSIHNSLDVIRKGTRWWVGNGWKIHIWEDEWLPTPSTYKVISPIKEFVDFPMVSSLINEDTHWWKVNVIHSLFLPFEAEAILRIPLSFNFPEDKLIWTRNKKATFIVKNAYYIAANLVTLNMEGECSLSTPGSLLWRKIWHLKIPPKVRIFAWRAWMPSLPHSIFAAGVWIPVVFPISMIRNQNRSIMLFYIAVMQSILKADGMAILRTSQPFLRTLLTSHSSSLIKAPLKT